MDLYRVLGVRETATPDEIKAAYKRLAFENHPDRNRGDKAREERFKEVAAAYEVLGDPEKRRRYDEEKAARARAENLWAAWIAPRPQPARQQTPPPAPAPPTVQKGTTDGGLLGELLAILGAALIGGAIANAVNGSGGYWDTSVGRRRGSDGRFRRS
jgi:curved DNA-binding protein CbpA